MLLGIVATTEFCAEHLVGLTSAAAARGWRCRGFLTDRGVRLLHSADLLELVGTNRLDLAVCEHSWEIYGSGAAPAGVTMASQYQNAELANQCDKVIVL